MEKVLEVILIEVAFAACRSCNRKALPRGEGKPGWGESSRCSYVQLAHFRLPTLLQLQLAPTDSSRQQSPSLETTLLPTPIYHKCRSVGCLKVLSTPTASEYLKFLEIKCTAPRGSSSGRSWPSYWRVRLQLLQAPHTEEEETGNQCCH